MLSTNARQQWQATPIRLLCTFSRQVSKPAADVQVSEPFSSAELPSAADHIELHSVARQAHLNSAFEPDRSELSCMVHSCSWTLEFESISNQYAEVRWMSSSNSNSLSYLQQPSDPSYANAPSSRCRRAHHLQSRDQHCHAACLPAFACKDILQAAVNARPVHHCLQTVMRGHILGIPPAKAVQHTDISIMKINMIAPAPTTKATGMLPCKLKISVSSSAHGQLVTLPQTHPRSVAQ